MESQPVDSSSLSLIVVPLLRGVVYQESDPQLWNNLLNLQARVRDYVPVPGLGLVLDEAEGYALLPSSPATPGETEPKMPRLVARRQLSLPVRLLPAPLRKNMAE